MKKGDNILCMKNYDVFKKHDIFTITKISKRPTDFFDTFTIVKNNSKQQYILSHYYIFQNFKLIPLSELRKRKLINLLYVVEEEKT